MSLKDIEFDEDDMEMIVEPLREVMGAFSDALYNTISSAVNPSAGAKAAVATSWIRLGDTVLRFMKTQD